MTDLRHLLAIYVHAHRAGNSVPPHIDADARAALAAEPAFAASEPSDEDLADLAEVFNGDPLPAMRRALELWGRPTIAALAAQPPAPAIGPEWRPCVKLPITVHVRDQRPDETHVSTREGITPVRPDDLIMRGVQGEEYPIGRDLFNRTYRLGAADPGGPAPAPAADGEREELAQWLERIGDDYDDLYRLPSALIRPKLARAAALLRQLPPEGVEAIRYCVEEDGAVIQRTSRAPESWAIRAGSSCMSTTGEWDIEPMPSERTDEWLANHRWPSAAAAWAALQQARRQEVGDE